MIRVAHILDTPGPGGAENVLVSLVRGLDPESISSSVCIREDSWMHGQLGNGHMDYMFLRDARALDMGLLASMVRYIKSNKIDVVHSHEFFMNMYGSLAAYLSGIPCIAIVHGHVDYAAGKLRRRMAYRRVASASHLVAVSNQLADRFSKEVGVPESRIHTIYNGIETEKFRAGHDLDSLRAELGIPRDAPVVGMVGNLYPVKGYKYFIKAMEIVRSEFPQAVFLVCGRGELRDELESLSAQCGLRDHIRFLGFRDDVPALLQLMDVFALSSLSEGLSLSILEAMAAGKPTVVTDVGGNSEIVVEGETGFLVPSEDEKKLAEKVCVLLRDKGLRDRLGKCGQGRVDSLFSQERMLEDYQNLYKALINERERNH